MPYSTAADSPASTATPPPSLATDNLPHTSTSTPAKPTTNPAIRVGAGLSRSQINATSAPKSGAVAFRTEANPAVTDRTA